jgi:hypothetical protein
VNADPLAHVRHLPIPEQIKYGAARYAFQHRYEPCKRQFNGVTVTWSRWFELVFKQTLAEYTAWCQQQDFYQRSRSST